MDKEDVTSKIAVGGGGVCAVSLLPLFATAARMTIATPPSKTTPITIPSTFATFLPAEPPNGWPHLGQAVAAFDT